MEPMGGVAKNLIINLKNIHNIELIILIHDTKTEEENILNGM